MCKKFQLAFKQPTLSKADCKGHKEVSNIRRTESKANMEKQFWKRQL